MHENVFAPPALTILTFCASMHWTIWGAVPNTAHDLWIFQESCLQLHHWLPQGTISSTERPDGHWHVGGHCNLPCSQLLHAPRFL